MASLEKRGGRYRIKFRSGRRQLSVALKTTDRKEAEGLLGKLEYNLTLVERGHLLPPEGADLGLFLLSDGRLSSKQALVPPLTLAEFFRRYTERVTSNKEENTRRIELIHIGHLERLIGARQSVRAITTERLQSYVDARSQEDGLSGKVSHVTIHKEVSTFGSIWNKWGVPQGLVSGPAPTRGLIYHKAKAKPPFQTWDQIERAIKRGGLSETEKEALWDSLYLTAEQIQSVLDDVKENAPDVWVYPAFVFAARTGARRSEILRSQIDDIDFEAETIRIREKKKDRSRQLTFRHVPLSPFLAEVLREWLANHPGGQLTFCYQSL